MHVSPSADITLSISNSLYTYSIHTFFRALFFIVQIGCGTYATDAATRCVECRKQMFLANMERMSGPMLVVRAAGYTMRQIAQYWKQTFGSSHSLHSSIGSIL